jgi:hypothetical protein
LQLHDQLLFLRLQKIHAAETATANYGLPYLSLAALEIPQQFLVVQTVVDQLVAEPDFVLNNLPPFNTVIFLFDSVEPFCQIHALVKLAEFFSSRC